VFWRVKLGPASSASQLEQLLRDQLGDLMVDNQSGNDTVSMLTLNQIWSRRTNQTVGQLIVLSTDWIADPVQPGKRQGWIWNYPTEQAGSYADAASVPPMLTKCSVGQIPQLLAWKQSAQNVTNFQLLGTWWTFTTAIIRDNTAQSWANYPNALNDFFVLSGGEIGNFLVVDFFGDRPEIMQIIWSYNLNKYATFPANNSTYGFQLLNNPQLPGTNFFSGGGSCDTSGSATTAFINEVIAIASVVLILSIIIVCVLPIVLIYRYCKKERKSGDNYKLSNIH